MISTDIYLSPHWQKPPAPFGTNSSSGTGGVMGGMAFTLQPSNWGTNRDSILQRIEKHMLIHWLVEDTENRRSGADWESFSGWVYATYFASGRLSEWEQLPSPAESDTMIQHGLLQMEQGVVGRRQLTPLDRAYEIENTSITVLHSKLKDMLYGVSWKLRERSGTFTPGVGETGTRSKPNKNGRIYRPSLLQRLQSVFRN